MQSWHVRTGPRKTVRASDAHQPHETDFE